jgi:oxalate decarboxylase
VSVLHHHDQSVARRTDFCTRTTFNIDDWLAHTPKDILAKNFGVDESVFEDLPSPNPYIVNGTVAERNVTDAETPYANGNSSFVYRLFEHEPEEIGGDGGTFYKIDSTNFPISKTIAATFVTLKPGALRELHWHPNVCSRPRPQMCD